jgi:hypothetical protein
VRQEIAAERAILVAHPDIIVGVVGEIPKVLMGVDFH